MAYVVLGFCLWILASIPVALLISRMMSQMQQTHQAQVDLMKEMYEKESYQSTKIMNDLLNRLMTRQWESYQSLSLSGHSDSPFSGEGIGLSDENEARRWAESLGGQDGIGEVIAEIETDQDLRELGLT